MPHPNCLQQCLPLEKHKYCLEVVLKGLNFLLQWGTEVNKEVSRMPKGNGACGTHCPQFPCHPTTPGMRGGGRNPLKPIRIIRQMCGHTGSSWISCCCCSVHKGTLVAQDVPHEPTAPGPLLPQLTRPHKNHLAEGSPLFPENPIPSVWAIVHFCLHNKR